MIIILAYLVGPTSPMLNTKSQLGHRPSGSRENYFKGLLPHMSVVDILGHVTKTICIHFN